MVHKKEPPSRINMAIFGITLSVFALLSQSIPAEKIKGVRRRAQSSFVLALKGDDGLPVTSFPLGNCEGDCDEDTDCAPGLLCFQRDGLVPVPGCLGDGLFNKDYCYLPANGNTNNNNSDSGLVLPPRYPGTIGVPIAIHSLSNTTITRVEPAYMLAVKAAPGKTAKKGGPPPPKKDSSGTPPDPTGTPPDPSAAASPPSPPASSKPQLAVVAVNLVPESAFPLKKCQGQCFSDRDCTSPFKCYKLFQRDPEVPGCLGTPEPGLGYCFNVSDYPRDNNVSGTVGFRLKMYWQPDYYWQEETFDRRWCLTCMDFCTIYFCNNPVSRFQFKKALNGSQIVLAQTNKCLERVQGNGIQLQPCNASKPLQWFLGNFSSTRFEIRPYGKPNACVIQTHHPKAGELIYVGNCTVAKAATSNYWTVF